MLKAGSKVRKFGLTVAPEAGTERLRLFIRKDFPDEAIYDTARVAFSNGWTAVKLYFMVGLPSETEEDLHGIANVCRGVLDIGRQYTRRATVNVTLSPFVPKPHTPFQWDEAMPEAEIFKKINLVKRLVRSGPINIRHNSTQTAMIAALVGRGDRSLADVIETAFVKGCRFDSWGELFDFEKWMAAFAEHNVDPSPKMKSIPFDAPLPWAHISKGPSTEHLVLQRKKTSLQLQPFVAHRDEPTPTPSGETSQMAFGRGKKRAAPTSTIAPTKNRVRLRWSKSARFRFMSHLENLRLLERTIRRARLPVMYSQGHNPSMRLSLGPPLPLGFTSEAEYIDVTLESNLMNRMIDDLRAQLPDGIEILEARAALGKKKSLSSALNRAEYILPVEVWSDRADLEESIGRLLATDTLECERGKEEKKKTIDLRPAIYDVRIEGDRLLMVLGLGEGGYAKPTELIGFLSEGLTMPIEALPFHRLAVYRLDDFGNRTEPMDL
jgi:radical SAM-linked protein